MILHHPLLSVLYYQSYLSILIPNLIIGSGAACHITGSLNNFTPSHDVTNSFVTLPNHQRVAVHSVGSVTLNKFLVLPNVLYIPSFHVNLIFVSALLHSLPVPVVEENY